MDALLIGLIIAFVATAMILTGVSLLYQPDVDNNTTNGNNSITKNCLANYDCVPAQCCHPTSCTDTAHRPDCKDIMCTMVCEGPIDCGAGSCRCVNNLCQVVPSGS